MDQTGVKGKRRCVYCCSIFEPFDVEGREQAYCTMECYEKFMDLKHSDIECSYCGGGAYVVDIIPQGRYTEVPACIRCFSFLTYQVAPTFHDRRRLVIENFNNL